MNGCSTFCGAEGPDLDRFRGPAGEGAEIDTSAPVPASNASNFDGPGRVDSPSPPCPPPDDVARASPTPLQGFRTGEPQGLIATNLKLDRAAHDGELKSSVLPPDVEPGAGRAIEERAADDMRAVDPANGSFSSFRRRDREGERHSNNGSDHR